MKNKQGYLKELFFSFFFSIPAVLITVVISWNPSKNPPASPFLTFPEPLILSIVLFSISFIIILFLFQINNEILFYTGLISSFIIFIGITSILAANLHRDYYTIHFQILLIFWIIFIRKSAFFYKGFSAKKYITHLYNFTNILYLVTTLWIILMAYSIVTRQEPRWAESTLYNSYNMLLSIVLFLSGIFLKVGIYRIVHISKNTIVIDDYDFSECIGNVNIQIIKCFLKKGINSQRCSEIFSLLNKNGIIMSKTTNWDCEGCLDKGYTVSKCPKYKNIENRIREIRKLFESLEIGTILYPENKMKILTEGWKLKFFDDVKISIKAGRNVHTDNV